MRSGRSISLPYVPKRIKHLGGGSISYLRFFLKRVFKTTSAARLILKVLIVQWDPAAGGFLGRYLWLLQ